MTDSVLSKFDAVVVLDTETTGISCKRDEIIELAALRAAITDGGYTVEEMMDEFIRLSPGCSIPPQIIQLTGITPEMIKEEGISKQQAAEAFAAMLSHGRTLIVAYNAQFDLCFLYFFLHKLGLADCLKGVKMLDAMTVYKDRREYPHKLCNAVDAYQLKTQNTHRAIDDAMATLELLEAMERENARRVTISHQQALSLQRRMRLRAETICEKYGLEPKRHAAAFRAACKKEVLALYGVKDAHDLPLRDYEAAQRAVDSFSCYALVRKRRAVENSLFEGSV